MWTGNQAVAIGLVDALGDLSGVLEQEFGVEHAKDYTVKPAFLERIMKYAASTAMDEIWVPTSRANAFAHAVMCS